MRSAEKAAFLSCRRHDLANGLTSPAGAQSLLDKYPREAVEVAMLKYVAEGRAAMGPSQLKVSAFWSPPERATLLISDPLLPSKWLTSCSGTCNYIVHMTGGMTSLSQC